MKVACSCPALCDPIDIYTVHGILQARILEWVEPFLSPENLPNPGIKPRSPTLQADSLPAKPLGKPKNTRVGSLSLLLRIFPTQESNQGLLHYRRILYQLSYQKRVCSVLCAVLLKLFQSRELETVDLLAELLWIRRAEAEEQHNEQPVQRAGDHASGSQQALIHPLDGRPPQLSCL